jgi:hypothetical protein
MKHLLLILLFIPFISIGQDMTYEDLMSFENTKQIERFLIERNYERFDNDNEEDIKYGYNVDFRDGKYMMNKGVLIGITNDTTNYEFDLFIDFMFTLKEDYNRIYDVAKKELEFRDVFDGSAIYSHKEIKRNKMLSFRIKEQSYYVTLMRVKEEEE